MKKIVVVTLIVVSLACLVLILIEFILPSLQPNNGLLSINTKGVQAKVYLDKHYLGTTPFYRENLRVGGHSVEIAQTGNLNFRWKTDTFLNSSALSIIDLDLASNQTFSAGENLYFKQGIASLSILTRPEGASIKIDGKLIGKAPQTLNLNLGVHLLLIEKPGYLSREVPLNMESGYKLSALVYLAANPFDKVTKIDSSAKASLFRLNNNKVDLTKSYDDWADGVEYTQDNFSGTGTRFDVLISSAGKVYILNEGEWKNKKAAKSVVNIGYLTKSETDKLSDKASKEWLKIKADFN